MNGSEEDEHDEDPDDDDSEIGDAKLQRNDPSRMRRCFDYQEKDEPDFDLIGMQMEAELVGDD